MARALLGVHDLTNTPLQNIEINVALIDQHGVAELSPYVERIQRAVYRLRESSKLLAAYEARLKWQKGDESFNPRVRLESSD